MMRRLLLATVAAVAMTLPAHSAVVSLGSQDWTLGGTALILSTAQPPGNQPQNVQCVICGEHQPGAQILGYNDYHNAGNQTDVRMFSTAVVPGGGGSGLANDQIGTAYGAGVLSGFYGSGVTFTIGVDVNDTNVPQRLESFYVLDLTNHTVIASYTGSQLVPSLQNGTGFPDYTLSSFTLTQAQAGHEILFFANLSGANDGPDSFFLIANTVPAVPEASTWMMMIAGFFGIGGLAIRRHRRTRFA